LIDAAAHITTRQIDEICDLVKEAAHGELQSRFAQVQGTRKHDGSIVTVADLAAQERIRNGLAKIGPSYRFLGEEMGADEQRRAFADDASGLWCLDPLDGTSNFAAGLPFYAVSLALVRGGEVQFGLVYDPCRNECFAAVRGHGAWLNGARLACAPAGLSLAHALAVVDFKRLAAPLARELAANPPYASQRSFGSVALDWCWLAANRYHVYVHGRQRLWDYAAGWLILSEAGGRSATLDGESVYSGTLAPRSAVAAVDDGLFEDWQRRLAEDMAST